MGHNIKSKTALTIPGAQDSQSARDTALKHIVSVSYAHYIGELLKTRYRNRNQTTWGVIVREAGIGC
jgi:hypothetical protein